MNNPTRKIPKFLREKTSDRVQPKTLVVAALTAITLAVISTYLTSLTNRLVFVALLSLLTAVVNEFYRLTLETAQSVIAKAVQVKVDERIEVLTGEHPVVTEEDLRLYEESIQENETNEKPIFWLFFHRLFVSRWAVPIVFAAVAFATLTGSYFLGENGKPNYEVVQQLTQTKDISGKKANEISQQANEKAESEAAQAESAATDLINSTKEELNERIEELSKQLETEETSNAQLRKDLLQLQKDLLQLQQEVAAQENDTPPSETTAPPAVE